jgi:uncharacterized protein YPO0396
MKSVIKLRLINWHYFANVTTEIKNITFLTGPNGTGKSTIIDALQILLLGSTRPDNFNKAANEKARSGRTLLSYLRGQTGIGDDGTTTNLREGSFTSYIAIEIADDVEKRVFTLGVVFDVDASDAVDKRYFYLDSPFPANDFSNAETEKNPKKVRPMVYKELSAFVRSTYKPGHFRFFDSDTDYQAFIKEAFGNLPDKYFSLFKKAVSFTPISDISSFITEYVCDADLNVDITPMQKNIEQYKMLEIEAKDLHAKVDVLTSIKASFDSMQSYTRQLDMLNYVNARVYFEESRQKLAALDDKLAKDNARLMTISDALGAFDKQVADINSDLTSYQAKRLQSSNYSLTEKLSSKKTGITSQISAITMAIHQVQKGIGDYAGEYQKLCSSFFSYYQSLDSTRFGEKVSGPFRELLELTKDVGSEAGEISRQIGADALDFAAVKAFRNDMESLKASATKVKSLLEEEFYALSNAMQSLQQDLSAVNSGKKPFDKLGPDYSTIKNALETSLRSRHSDAQVSIYCDLVDVNDPEWTFALEAVLTPQKFNFFVNPAYYEEANRLLKELTDSYHYYRVSLIDTERLLAARLVPDDGSLAFLIDTKDAGARAYTDFLLGHIRKCATFDEARNSGSGLLADATGYRGYATWYLNKANARTYYLGTCVSNDTKALSAKEYQESNTRYSLLSEAMNKLATLLTLPVMSLKEIETNEADLKRVDEISVLQKSLAGVDQEMVSATQGDMSAVVTKIDQLKASLVTIDGQRSALLTEKGGLNSEVTRLNAEQIPQENANLEGYRKTLDAFTSETVNKEYDPFYSKLVDAQHMTLAQIRLVSTREYIAAQNKQKSDRDNLFKLRADYCAQYHLNYAVSDTDHNEEFDKELENISKVMLPEYESKITKAHESSIKEFKDDFIYKLRTAIESVTAQIDDLNRSLADFHFGRDSYQFKVSPNKDYLSYYQMIMDPLLLKAGDAENLFMEKYQTTMNDLFGLISSATNASGEQKEQVLRNIQTFTSYTTYVLFDLLVTRGTGTDLQTISLGRSFRSQSGGETQTPFYLAILASFASLSRANNPKDSNTLRLVIFDEAFSKMDSARIMKSTDLLRQFGLQAILSTPSEKIRDLVNYVDLILVTIHDEKKKRSGIDVYEEKKKADASDKEIQEYTDATEKRNAVLATETDSSSASKKKNANPATRQEERKAQTEVVKKDS